MSTKLGRALGEKFAFTLVNSSGSAKIVAILAAFFDTLKVTTDLEGSGAGVVTYTNPANIVAAGYSCDAVADDGTITPGLTVTPTNSKMSYRQFRKYLENMGRTCVEIIVQANNEDVFNGVIEVNKITPLTGSNVAYLPMYDFKDVNQYSNNKIVIPVGNLEMNFDTLMLFPIPDGRTVTISFKF